uniref:Uncharacterized protein n=1 Tax=Utricularia reniformis TaxID=192314 RepID=A0A1Y0B0N3_9LAMI|nr:hypothetical protein AEK19_MT0714 [Utricularia reniformis]ART30960.1 hypothetical protein AEK19_MT0714 [Utricularia reniformis]
MLFQKPSETFIKIVKVDVFEIPESPVNQTLTGAPSQSPGANELPTLPGDHFSITNPP